MLDVKKWIAKMTKAVDTPCVVAVTFTQVITSKKTGSKTASATISVPSGYEVIPNCRPVSLYISGAGTVTVADRGVVNMNGTTASFTYYLNNPNSYTGSLDINASILCRRVGGVVRKLLNTLQSLTSERGWVFC